MKKTKKGNVEQLTRALRETDDRERREAALRRREGMSRPSSKVTRFEVIDLRASLPVGEIGRVFTAWNCNIELSYQDDGRTLKVFVNDREQ